MKRLCIFLIRFYKKHLSSLKGRPCCRFVPCCSSYALEAFEKRGFFVGMILTVWRILRCNPWNPGGYDPVPERGLRYKGSRKIPTPNEGFCGDCHDDCREDDGNEFASCEEENGEAGSSSIHRKDKNQ